jgi:HlyD family secretion protein
MRGLPSSSPRMSEVCCRAGFSTRGLFLALSLVLAVPAIAWSVLRNGPWSLQGDDGPMMHRVERGQFIHEITERGDVESASNVEIVSKVKSGGYGGGGRSGGGGGSSGGVAILWIIPEGTNVEPGDKVVELDSSALDLDRIQQEIVVHNSEATVIQARNVLDAAEIAKEEYLKGTYREDELSLDNQIEEATEKRDRLKEYWEFSKMMNEKGYVTKLQLQADYSALLQAENQLELAQLQRKVLGDYKKRKMVLQLDADIATAKAKLAAEEASFKLDQERLEDLKEQIKNCTIYTQQAGQVVYANREGHRGTDDVIIEEGTLIRERQPIIRLPDPKRMQVKARINEAKISLVKTGMSATVRLDAFPDTELKGVVQDVKEYPAPTGWWGSNVKEYETIIKILDPSIGLRPGYTAQVKIRVEQLPDVLQVPVQAIIEHGKKDYCVLRDGTGFRAREVILGSTNDKTVVIEGGLEEGEEVVLNANAYRKEVGLPDVSPEARAQEEPRPPEDRPEAEAAGQQRPPERRGGPPNPGQLLQRLDKNSNGQLDRDELEQLPEPLRSRLEAADRNGDGNIDRGELAAPMGQFGSGGRREGPGAADRREGPGAADPRKGPGAADPRKGPGAGQRPRGRNPGNAP